MLLRRIYDEDLAQAAYLLGCEHAGDAIVIDPGRDIERYIVAAEQAQLRIAYVTETHIHADFASGARELAEHMGATLLLSGEGGADWSYRFAGAAHARLLKHGDTIRVGDVSVEVLHTPGHTPEHLTFLVTDLATAALAVGALTGDFIFVCDVGRPDLLERAANVSGSMDGAARSLFTSIQQFKTLPGHLQLWPGHGAGSACGKSLGAMPQSTLGYERLSNWAFQETDIDDFVTTVLAGQPEPPTYFATMKVMTRDGVPSLGTLRLPVRLDPASLVPLLEGGAIVIDARPATEFAAGHVAGTVNIPLNRSFSTWAGWLLDYDRDVYLIVNGSDDTAVRRATRALASIGYDRVAGVFGPDAVDASDAAGFEIGQIPQMSIRALEARMSAGDIHVIDVRGESEWREGHVPGAENLPVGLLQRRLAEIPAGHTVAVMCQGGGRSAIAASILAASGRRDVANVQGGFRAWSELGLPVERP